ncbi:hypothetical protein ANO11243_066730 [Dothideomycetidae sp. 11243]|nr:hypothetical protein ANO11243_066730 [fungal sp. No.11243]
MYGNVAMARKPGFNPWYLFAIFTSLVILAVMFHPSSDAIVSKFTITPESPSTAYDVSFEDEEPDAPMSRLNTTWHAQIAVESAKDTSDWEAVKTPSGISLSRKRVALLSTKSSWSTYWVVIMLTSYPVEDRPLPYMIPLLVHFISTVPPEWSFRFMGSQDSIDMIKDSPLCQRYIEDKKLFVDLIPYQLAPDISHYNTISTLLTSAWLYEEWLWPAEWVFVFQLDSMICSNSKTMLNDFVDQDFSFLGAYTGEQDISTGGGFSLRKVSHLARIINESPYETYPSHGTEDFYFSMALSEKSWAKVPTGPEAMRWALVRSFPDTMEDMPLGFHTYSSDGMFRGKDGQSNQNKAYEYCPELGIITVGRWNCQCSPDPSRRGGLGG